MQCTALSLKRQGRRIGLVPTMGYLHQGHLSLVRMVRSRADLTVVSIFVNPTQFGPGEDLDAYPRDFDRDAKSCRENGAEILFYPNAARMYQLDHSVYIEEHCLARTLCGASRPGHFRGVCTIVAKLFNLVLPDVACFGEKDAQQLRIIRRMVRDLDFPVEIISAPIVREVDGLAMSSRNYYLNPAERSAATCLRHALDQVEHAYSQGERDVKTLKKIVHQVIEPIPQARFDYAEIVDDETLQPVDAVLKPVLVALAVFIGKTRLIDNTVLGPDEK